MKKTAIIGASPNPARYSYIATERLQAAGHPVYPIGIREGFIGTIPIITSRPDLTDIDTVTLYVGPANQPSWIPYILSLKPRRIIFNPGTENDDFRQMAESKGIQTEYACTLVLLSLKNF